MSTNVSQKEKDVAQLYVATFGRAADHDGLEYWVSRVDEEGLDGLATIFYNSQEAIDIWGSIGSNHDFVKEIYQNVLARNPDQDGWDYWTEQLDNGSVTRDDFIYNTLKVVNDGPDGTDKNTLTNKQDVGIFFAESGLTDLFPTGGVSDQPNTLLAHKDDIYNKSMTFDLSPDKDNIDEGEVNTFTLKATNVDFSRVDDSGRYVSGVLEDTDVDFQIIPAEPLGSNVGTLDTNKVDFDINDLSVDTKTIWQGEDFVAFEVTGEIDPYTGELDERYAVVAKLDHNIFNVPLTGLEAEAVLLDVPPPGTLNLTVNPSDNVMGTTGDDTITGSYSDDVDSSTLHMGDTVDGGTGDDRLTVTVDGGNVNGFTMSNVQTMELDNFGGGEDDTEFGMVNVHDVETIVSNNSTGDIKMFNVQELADLELKGSGDVSDHSNVITYELDYKDGLVQAGDTQAVQLDGFHGKLDVANSGEMENVAITTVNNRSEIILADGSKTLTVDGDQNLKVGDWMEGHVTNGLTTVTSTLAPAAALNFTGAMADHSTIKTADGDDKIDVRGNNLDLIDVGNGDNEVDAVETSNGKVEVHAGTGKDDIDIDGGYDIDVVVNAGNNKVDVNTADLNAIVDITTGGGKDDIDTNGDDIHINAGLAMAAHPNVVAGDGDNDIDVTGSRDTSNIRINTAGGADDIDVTRGDYIMIKAGEGLNEIDVDSTDNGYVDITTGSGNDKIGQDGGVDGYNVVINAGDGDNVITVDTDTALNYAYASVTTGKDNDLVTINNNETYISIKADLGAGDDRIILKSLEDSNTNPNQSPHNPYHNIDAGKGADTLVLPNIDVANASNTFSDIKYMETVEFTNTTSGVFDAELTKANGAGVENYNFMDGLGGSDTTMKNLDSGVTISIDQRGQGTYGKKLTLDGLGATAATNALTLNVVTSTSNFIGAANDLNFDNDGVNISDVQTLNIGTEDTSVLSPNSPYRLELNKVSTLDLGEFNADADLQTLNISGNMLVESESVNAEGLTRINAAGIAGNDDINGMTHQTGRFAQSEGLTMTIDDAADTLQVDLGANDDTLILNDDETALTATGGAGDDTITGNDKNDDINGNAGNDTIDGGNGNNKLYGEAGEDDITAGNGVDTIYGGDNNDIIRFDGANMTAADLVYGGEVTDSIDQAPKDWDTVEVTGGVLTADDAFFYKWDNIEELRLDTSGGMLEYNDITLGAIASDSGIQKITLGDEEALLTLEDGYAAAGLEVELGNGIQYVINDVTTTGPNNGATDLTVVTTRNKIGEYDTLKGGEGDNDTIEVSLRDGQTSSTSVFGDGSSWKGTVTEFENIVIKDETSNTVTHTKITTDDTTVAAGETLTVTDVGTNARDYVTFDGSDESDGVFNINLTAESIVNGGDTTAAPALTDPLTDPVADPAAYDDKIVTHKGDDRIYGNGGQDYLDAGNGTNHVEGGSGDDVIITGTGNDTIYGDGGNDNITSGNSVTGDKIYGGLGDDTITAGNATAAGAGNTIEGGAGKDTITSGSGDDNIKGGIGQDSIKGGAGDDTIDGGADSDIIEGGEGQDTLTSGSLNDHDTFVYKGDATSGNTISNFESGTMDTITDFDSATNGADHDVIDISGGLEGSGTYLQEVNGYAAAQQKVADHNGGAVLDTDDTVAAGKPGVETLYVDSDQDGLLLSTDLNIGLDGVDDMSNDDFIM